MASQEIDKLIKIFAKLPGLGTRSARRIVLNLLKNNDTTLKNLIAGLTCVQEQIKVCPICGNFDTTVPCSICSNEKKDASVVCVVQDVADLWAMDRVSQFKGKYHVLGGILSAIEGITPQDLNVESLIERIKTDNVQEIILALPATVDGQITAHYISSRLKNSGIKITTLAQGIPMGAELDYMDEGTLQLALNSRKSL